MARSNLSTGRPKKVKAVVYDKDNPDNYPTLLRYLQATGKVKHVNSALMFKARSLYWQGFSTQKIAETIEGIEPAVIDRWALIFGWDEERDKRLFNQFRKIATVSRQYGEDISIRHDRIAAGLEQIAERMLQQHANGTKVLSTKDLAALTGVLKGTQEIRGVSRGLKREPDGQTASRSVHIHMNHPANTEKVANALVDMFQPPKLVQVKTKTIAVGVAEDIGSDIEYEGSANRDSDSQQE